MRKTKMILKYIKNMDYKNMFKIARNISKKARKNILFIFVDIVYCGFIYGAGYYDYQEFEFYLLNKKERKTYLTRVKNNEIVKTYNNREFFKDFNDKIIFNKKFEKFLKRDYLKINEDSYEDFTKFIKKHQEVIVKPIDGEGGKGVEKFSIDSKTDFESLFKKLLNNKQILIEECLKQHQDINELYDKSVNTLRLFTFFDGNDAYVLNSVFKIGNGGVTDNFSSGSMYTFVDDKGKIIVPAIDQDDKTYLNHPITNKEILGFIVPYYDEACQMVKETAKIIPQVKYIGWDVAITPNGPAIIEGNCFPGIFQIKPSFGLKKEGLIPKYQKVMKIK